MDAPASLAFDSEQRMIWHSEDAPKMLKGHSKRKYTFETFKQQGDKRFYKTSSFAAPGGEITHSRTTSWNGEILKSYSPLIRTGQIYNSRTEVADAVSAYAFAVHGTPYDFLLLSQSDAEGLVEGMFHQYLYEDVRILGETESIDDSECLVLFSESRGKVLWLDISRGYVVKRSKDYFVGDPDVKSRVRYNREFIEIAPGQWVPSVSNLIYYMPGDGPDNENLATEIEFKFTNMVLLPTVWVVNGRGRRLGV